jgi:NAD kinase
MNAKINEGEEIEIIPNNNSVLAIDSIRETKLKEGDRVKIKISDNPLKRIV